MGQQLLQQQQQRLLMLLLIPTTFRPRRMRWRRRQPRPQLIQMLLLLCCSCCAPSLSRLIRLEGCEAWGSGGDVVVRTTRPQFATSVGVPLYNARGTGSLLQLPDDDNARRRWRQRYSSAKHLSRHCRSMLPELAAAAAGIAGAALDENENDGSSGGGGPLDASELTSDNNNIVGADEDDAFWMNVGAAIAQESCPLLGVKSLGVDYGLVRTGLAVTVGYDPTPLAILSDWNTTDALCVEICSRAATQQAVQRIIVGLPLHKNGTVAEQTRITLAFATQLAAAVLSQFGPHVPVLLFDERYTSKEAAARAHSRHPPRQRQAALYGTLDAVAACIILENYYEDNGVGAHPVPLSESVQRACLEQYAERTLQQEKKRLAGLEKNDAKMRRRKEAMARGKLEEEGARLQLLAASSANGCCDESSTKKRKKKKKK